VCKCVLPPGDNPIAVNKYINIKKIFRANQLVQVGAKVIASVPYLVE
jgi:hypothetical protein